MSCPDEEKLGVKHQTLSFRDTISTIPIKKRRLYFSRSPSPPPETQSLATSDYETAQDISSCLVQVPSLEAGTLPTPLTALSDKGSSFESGFNILANGDISEPPKHQNLTRHDCNDRKQVEIQLKDTISDGKFVFLNEVEPPSGPVGNVDLSMEEENLDAQNILNESYEAEIFSELHCEEASEKFHTSESCSLRQGQLEMQDPSSRNKEKLDAHDSLKKSLVSEHNTASAQISLPRSNWDLNITMDAWEESLSDSAVKKLECDGNGGTGFGGLLDKGPQPNLMGAGATGKRPNESLPMFGESKSLSIDSFPSLHTSPKTGSGLCNSETEAYLDLRLKPSFVPESYFTCGNPFNLENVDSFQEMKFLSLSMNPTSTPEPNFFVCGGMKPEPLGCIPVVEKKTEIYGSETLVLKPIKFESCKIREASGITISGVANSASAAALKPDPVDDRDQSPDCAAANETRVSYMITYDQNLLQSAKIPHEAVDTRIMASSSKYDSFIKDVILQTPREYPSPQYEMDGMAQVMQATKVFRNNKRGHSAMSAGACIRQPEIGFAVEPLVDEGKGFSAIKHASDAGSEHAGFSIKCLLEEGQNTSLVSDLCKQNVIAANLLQVSSTSGTLIEKVYDEKTQVVSCTSLSEVDSRTEPGEETYLNCDPLEFNQANDEFICMMEEEQCNNECKPGSSHVTDGVMRAVFEKGGVDDHGYEDGELRDGGSLGASHLILEIEKAKDVCPRGVVDVPVAMLSSHEHMKHMTIGSPEMSKDPGTIECVNNFDPAIAADLQESSSVTGDSSGRKTSRTIRKLPRDSLRKDEVFERKTKFDSDPTIVNIGNKGEGSYVMEDAGGHVKSFFPLSGEAKKDTFDRGHSGRIINLNSPSSRNLNHIHEGPLSSRIEREKSTYKSFKRGNCCSGRSRDENPSERPHKTENEKRRGWACGKRVSGSVHMRVRGRSDSPHSMVRDERRPNQFGDRNFDFNYMLDESQGHDDFQYSRSIPSVEVSMNSISDARSPYAGRISRKATIEPQSRARMLSRRHSPGGPEQMPVMHHPTSEVSPSRCMQRDAPDLIYVSQEKNCRTIPGETLDRSHQHGQFERADRIPVRRERLSLSPVRRRGLPQLSPAICSPRSQAMSPSHWSTHTPPEDFNGAETVWRRSGAPILTQESTRSTRQHFTKEILVRRRGSGYGARLPDGMIEVEPARIHDFPRSGRDFSRKIQPRQVPSEYRGSSYARGQIHELAADSECAVRRRYNEVHESVRYRQRCIVGEDENFSFHDEEGPSRSYMYQAEGNQGFNDGGNSRGIEGRFKNRLGNTSNRFRHIEEQHLHEDGFRHQPQKGWNDSGFNNVRPRSRRY